MARWRRIVDEIFFAAPELLGTPELLLYWIGLLFLVGMLRTIARGGTPVQLCIAALIVIIYIPGAYVMVSHEPSHGRGISGAAARLMERRAVPEAARADGSDSPTQSLPPSATPEVVQAPPPTPPSPTPPRPSPPPSPPSVKAGAFLITPNTGGLFVQRNIIIYDLTPGWRYCFVYVQPNGVERELLESAVGQQLCVVASDIGQVVLPSFIPGQRFHLPNVGTWQLGVCAYKGACSYAPLVIESSPIFILPQQNGLRR
jgi:hypothetical protein